MSMRATPHVQGQEPLSHPVHRSLNKPLTIWGIDRRLFFLAAIIGAATFNFFASVRGGVVMFLTLYVFFRRITRQDAELLGILLRASQFHTVYDSGKAAAGLSLGRRMRA